MLLAFNDTLWPSRRAGGLDDGLDWHGRCFRPLMAGMTDLGGKMFKCFGHDWTCAIAWIWVGKCSQVLGVRSDLRDRIWVGKCSSVWGTIGPVRSNLGGKMLKCFGHDRAWVGRCPMTGMEGIALGVFDH